MQYINSTQYFPDNTDTLIYAEVHPGLPPSFFSNPFCTTDCTRYEFRRAHPYSGEIREKKKKKKKKKKKTLGSHGERKSCWIAGTGLLPLEIS